MELTGKHIAELSSYARFVSKQTDVEDVVQDAILIGLQSGFHSIEDYKKQVKKSIFSESQTENRKSGKTYDPNDTTKTCKICKEEKPIGGFYIFRYRKINKEIISSYCIDCHAKKAAQNYLKRNLKEISRRATRLWTFKHRNKNWREVKKQFDCKDWFVKYEEKYGVYNYKRNYRTKVLLK